MDPEIATYAESIERRLHQIADAIDGMTASQLNSRATASGTNSAWVLAQHTLGNARAWVLGIICGQERDRDRPGEFASVGENAAAFASDVAAFTSEMAAALAAVSRHDLHRRLVPAQHLWGEGTPREMSIRDCFIHVVEHASLHLGHLELTRQLCMEA